MAKIKTPRSLNKEQQDRIASKVKVFPGTPFDLWVSLDGDSAPLMYAIEDILRSAGWQFTPITGVIHFDGRAGIVATSGVVIQIAEGQRPALEIATSVLTSALIAEGISATARANANSDDPVGKNKNAIHVIIGSRELK